MAVIPHASAAFKRNNGTKSPATVNATLRSEEGMPVREQDPYNAKKVREAIQAALDKADVAKSSVGKRAGLADRTVGKFLSGGTESMSLANAIRLAHSLGISVSELIGEAAPQSGDAGQVVMAEDELHDLIGRHLRVAAEMQQILAQRRGRK